MAGIALKNPIPKKIGPFMLLVALWGLVLGCGSGEETTMVDFSHTRQVARPAEPRDSPHTLRVAVGAMISPLQTFIHYQQLMAYLGRKVGRPVKLVQRKTYGEINKLLGKGEIEAAFVCSGPYVTGKDAYGLKLLAAPVVQGRPRYRSYLIVKADSPYHRLADLRGLVFAFTDPQSNTGRLVPTFWLHQKGLRPEGFFASTIYTYSHDNSIMAVGRGLVHGAAVDSLIWEYYRRSNPALTARTRVIKKSRWFGIPPVVASRHLDPHRRAALQTTLLKMHQDPAGRLILDRLMIERFVAAQDQWYDSVRLLLAKLQMGKEGRRAAAQP